MAVETRGRTDTIPTIELGGLRVTRLTVGGNPFSGFSHQSEDRDREMRRYFSTERIHQTLFECEKQGINAFVGRADNHITRVLLEYWDKGGTIQWVAQTAAEMASLEENIKHLRYFGAKACVIHGGTVGRLWDEGKPGRVKELLAFIKDHGLPAGMASHDPEVLEYAEREGFGADFYMACVYNIASRMGKLHAGKDDLFVEADREKALSTIPLLSRPTIAYKVLAAGRRNPESSFREVLCRIKKTDGILVGMYPGDNPEMVKENATLVKRILQEEPAS